MRRVPHDSPWWKPDDVLPGETYQMRRNRLMRADKVAQTKRPEEWHDGIPNLFVEMVLTPMAIDATRYNLAYGLHRELKARYGPEYESLLAKFHEKWSPPVDTAREMAERRTALFLQNIEKKRKRSSPYRQKPRKNSADPASPTTRDDGGSGGHPVVRTRAKPAYHTTPPAVNPPGTASPSHGIFPADGLPLDSRIEETLKDPPTPLAELRAQTSPFAVSFWSQVIRESDRPEDEATTCWLWVGPRTASGWGVDPLGRLARRTAFLTAAAGEARMTARSLQCAARKWGLKAANKCVFNRLCCRPAHFAVSFGDNTDYPVQRRVDEGLERVISEATPPEIAYRLTRDARLVEFEEAMRALMSGAERQLAEQCDVLREMQQPVSELTARFEEANAAFLAGFRRLDAILQEVNQERKLLADFRQELKESFARGRNILAKDDVTSIHPKIHGADRPVVLAGASDGGPGEGTEDVVLDIPVVPEPAAPMVFEARKFTADSIVSADLEELGAVGRCARVWIVSTGKPFSVAELQSLADAWKRDLSDTVYDAEAFVFGLCTLISIATKDVAFDGTIPWIEKRIYLFAERVREEVRVRVKRGQALISKTS